MLENYPTHGGPKLLLILLIMYILFPPPNTNSYIHLLDSLVISAFKYNYLRFFIFLTFDNIDVRANNNFNVEMFTSCGGLEMFGML